MRQGVGPQNWGQSPIRRGTADKFNSAGPNWDPTPNLLQRARFERQGEEIIAL